MPLFQKSVLNKFLKAQDQAAVAKAYKKFSKHFHNATIQENIRKQKEEQYQEGFLRELFVDVLGYTLNPQPKFNLTTELKNETGAKKADGAILLNGKALGVIELKGTDTKDLEKVRQQAFDYKANQSACVYVVTSNFEKLRFYINNAVEFEEFDLFTLNEKQFELLYFCLGAENVLDNKPLRAKEASITEEENITKKFYADYSLFKRELYRDLVKRNLKSEVFREQLQAEDETRAVKNIKLTLFKKSQKLIDRFLFIFFAEDRGLLPPNSTQLILDEWNKLKDMDAAQPLYHRFKLYFSYLDTGRKGTNEKAEIFAYNGGLFKPDGTLDSLELDDELLYKHTKTLAGYDFESQVDVNILGHIFENSLNEIESVNAEIEGTDFDKQKTKRKKDGVFYTPKYITKYIVDNTVGKLCTEKRAELGIIDEEYTKNRQLATKKILLEKLENYRGWLLELTICDPACGSGAFLNQALDFLINEHRAVDELQASLSGGSLVFQEIENTILEKNIYGVDLNEESVEIAKLSLWLRTAQPRRKLNDLNNNIKCGNSLIESKAVAGDKAFKWEAEFPEVFAEKVAADGTLVKSAGFDVVIGNPPYVQSHALDETTKKYIYSNYTTAEYQVNTYGIFLEKIISLLGDNKNFSVIIPNYWLSTKFDSKLRSVVFLQNHCLEVLNVFSVFQDATVDTVILTVNKSVPTIFPKDTKVRALNRNLENIDLRLSAIDGKKWAFETIENFKSLQDPIEISFDNKFRLNGENTMGDYIVGFQGMKPYEKGKGTPIQTREMMNGKIYHSNTKLDETYFPLIGAMNVQRFNLKTNREFIKYGKNLAAPRKLEIFTGPRLLLNRILSKEKIDVLYVNETIINNTDVFNFVPKSGQSHLLKPMLSILGSKLCSKYFKKSNVNLDRQAFPKLNVNHIESFPVPILDANFSNKAEQNIDLIIDLIRHLNNLTIRFNKYLLTKLGNFEFNRKLQSWHDLTFSDFIKELNKAIKTSKGTVLTKLQEMEWMEVFETKKAEALALKAEIEKVDREIDGMVYELYGLTEEEIRIVEGG